METNQEAKRLEQFGKLKYGDKRGWQKEFAEALEMSSGSLRNYLSGKFNVGRVLQDKLRALGCNIEWLLSGEGSPFLGQNIDAGRPLSPLEFALLEELRDVPDLIPDLVQLVRTQKQAKKLMNESKSILDKLKGKPKK